MAFKRPSNFGGSGPGPNKRQSNDEGRDGEAEESRSGFGSGTVNSSREIPSKHKANFINFQKSGGTETYIENDRKKSSDIPDINLKEHISARDILDKQKFLKQLLFAANRKQAEGKTTSETDLLSISCQLCKTNPRLSYIELGRIDKEDYPSMLQGRKLPSTGFICEIRVQVEV